MTVYFRELEDSSAGKRWTSYWDKHEGCVIEYVNLDAKHCIRKRHYSDTEQLAAAMDRVAKRNKITKDTTFTKPGGE